MIVVVPAILIDAVHWRDGTATLSEIEDADIQLMGMRRLLAEKVQALEVQA